MNKNELKMFCDNISLEFASYIESKRNKNDNEKYNKLYKYMDTNYKNYNILYCKSYNKFYIESKIKLNKYFINEVKKYMKLNYNATINYDLFNIFKDEIIGINNHELVGSLKNKPIYVVRLFYEFIKSYLNNEREFIFFDTTFKKMLESKGIETSKYNVVNYRVVF